MSAFLVGWLAATPAYMAPLLLACLGILVCERAGVMNLTPEGVMATGAMTGAVVTLTTGSPWTGLLAGTAAGLALSAVFAVAVVLFKAEQILAGLATVAIGAGLAAVFGRAYTHKPFAGLPDLDPGPLADIPLLGPVLFAQDPVVWLSLLLACALAWLLARTRTGLRLRAVGEDPATADSAGVDVQAHQLLAVLAGGALIGLAGAYLSVVASQVWVDGMVAGRGWIAVALVVFAQWKPLRAILGAILFGAADALLPRLLAIGADVPSYLMAMLPYALTIAVLAGMALLGRGQGAQPAALGRVFLRQDRHL
ncbi:MAG: ABC transporter permease [Geminicoccaceae bacterium]